MSGFLEDRVLDIQGRPSAVALAGNRHYIHVGRDTTIRVVVGEAMNNVCLDHSLACTGAFMRRWLSEGLSQNAYLRVLARRNVCDFDRDFRTPSKPLAGARRIVEEMARAVALVYRTTGDFPRVRMLLCGRRVWDAFALGSPTTDVGLGYSETLLSLRPEGRVLGTDLHMNLEVHCLPHPSGRNREWNDPAFAAEWREVFRRLALD